MTSQALIKRVDPQRLGQTHLLVSRFKEHAYEHDDPEGNPSAEIWIVLGDALTRKATGKSWCIWIDPEFYAAKRVYSSPLLDWIQRFDRQRSKFGFVEGRPMTDFAICIPVCVGSNLPRKLTQELSPRLTLHADPHSSLFVWRPGRTDVNTQYRVVHAGQPWGGARARGYDKITTNPLTFQMHFQRHLKWQCRDLSPFMSATNNFGKVQRIAAVYEARGFQGIKLLVIRTSNVAAWGDTRVFHARTLINCFNLPNLRLRRYFDHEWLIESEIPAGCFTEVSLEAMTSQMASPTWKQYLDEARAVEEAKLSRKRVLALTDHPHEDVQRKKQRTRTNKYAKVDH